jgi:hypothetical protein
MRVQIIILRLSIKWRPQALLASNLNRGLFNVNEPQAARLNSVEESLQTSVVHNATANVSNELMLAFKSWSKETNQIWHQHTQKCPLEAGAFQARTSRPREFQNCSLPQRHKQLIANQRPYHRPSRAQAAPCHPLH